MNSSQSLLHTPFLLKTLCLAIAAASSLGAYAQQATGSDEIEEIIVQGSNLSRQRAIEQKQMDSRLIEALGADELGQFPDRNVGESLNRLPGVSMLVEKGEGRFVQIRGINPALNNVTINGVQMGSPEQEGGGRAAPMDVISGGVLGGVQVVKTPTADMDSQGIGGTVNVKTTMPFDRNDEFYGYVTSRFGRESVRPESQAYAGQDPRALDAMVSGKLANSTVGWLLGATWSDREYVGQGIYQDDWDESSGVGLPVNVKNNYYIIGRERTNLNAALEFRPTDNDTYYVRGFYAKWQEFQHRNRYEQNLSAGVVPTNAGSGVSGKNRILANVRLEEADKDLFSFSAGGENVMDQLTLSYMVQSNSNELAEPNDNWEFRSGASFGPNTWTHDSDGVVTITPDAGTPNRQDPSLIDFRRVRFFDRSMQEDAHIAKVDLQWDLDDMSYVKTGLKYSNTDRSLDDSQRRFNPGSAKLNLGTSSAFTKGAFRNDADKYNPPNIWMNLAGMNAFIVDPANAKYFAADAADDFVSNNAADYGVEESVWAAYVMGSRRFDRLELIAGVRYESTDVNSSGNVLNNGTVKRIKASGDYSNVMPSLIANYRLNDQFVARAGITRALGRPDFETIAPRSTISDDGGPIAGISIGNPDLTPRKSTNYDLSLEWYPDTLSILSLSVFYKDIKDELIGSTTSLTSQAEMNAALAARGLTGVVDTSTLTRLDLSTTINASSASLKGVELMGQTQLSFLPAPFDGLGVSASLTRLDGETKLPTGNIPLVGQPESTYAFSLFYQNDRIDASVSYAYNDSFLTDMNANPDLVLDQGEFGRWDAKLSYSLWDNLKIFLEGVNLNDEPTSEFQGGRSNWNTEYEWVGRTYYMGVSYGF
ncbi:MAG: TonB-dependent receptor [Pseudomonadales bacterium]|nr:TonB-dependent receptor [Pseudomonadales bacterium]